MYIEDNLKAFILQGQHHAVAFYAAEHRLATRKKATHGQYQIPFLGFQYSHAHRAQKRTRQLDAFLLHQGLQGGFGGSGGGRFSFSSLWSLGCPG